MAGEGGGWLFGLGGELCAAMTANEETSDRK